MELPGRAIHNHQGHDMKRLIQVFAGLAVLGWAGAASADGMNARRGAAPMDLPAADCCQARWGGLYIGASVGVGMADTDFSEVRTGPPTPGASSYDLSGTGITGTVAVGYDRQLHGNMVAGVFVDYTFGELDASFTLPAPVQQVSLVYDDTWAVGARLGFARSCCTLWYATAGYTRTSVNFGDGFRKEDLDGYFLGLGVEQQIRDRLTLKLEYRFSDYGETTYIRCHRRTLRRLFAAHRHRQSRARHSPGPDLQARFPSRARSDEVIDFTTPDDFWAAASFCCGLFFVSAPRDDVAASN